MLSNCMMSKTRAITKICRCAELTDTLNTWRKRFIMIIIMLCSFEIFTSCQGSMRTFSKHYSKCKTVSIKFRKTLQERRLPILKFSQDNPQNNFLNFLTSKNIFITLQYSGDIETDNRGMFLEYSGNITKWLLEFAERSTFVIIKSYTFNTKATFPSRTFKKIFSLKMFTKCSLDVLNIVTLREHTANIPRILRAGWDTIWCLCLAIAL